MSELTRRSFTVATGGALATLGGCLGAGAGDTNSDGPDGSTPTVTCSFFVFGEFARAVAGDALEVETLVPFGQHGHGWEPAPGIQRDIGDSRAFVYAGEGFQPWADRVVENIRGGDADTAVIAARHGVELLPLPGEGDDHDGHESGTEHDGHEEGGNHTGDDHQGHDHGAVDPHFWLDPTRAATAVSTIEAGLSDAFPEHTETFAANAAAYREELAVLDAAFADRLDATERDSVFVAGHNAFQYLATRYSFEIHTLTGLSPDDTPSQKDIERAQRLIDEEGISHVLAPAFESDRAARQLVRETDAVGTLPITALPGITEAWAEDDWGYLDIMREVNLESLATGLGA